MGLSDSSIINNNGEMNVPLGSHIEKREVVRQTFSGMDNYFETFKIKLINTLKNGTIDVMEISSQTYGLKITSGLKRLFVISTSSYPVQYKIVDNFQKKKLYESVLGPEYYPSPGISLVRHGFAK